MARQSIVDAGKTPSWAGATPLLGAFGCPKNHGGRSSPRERNTRSFLQSVLPASKEADNS
jgi:hypothetical protein